MIKFYDRIYGQIELGEKERRLFDFPEFRRLRLLAQSNNGFFQPGSYPSRLEHSLGVYFLASKIVKKKEFKGLEWELKFTALLHDLGQMPFSHLSESYLLELTGLDHEKYSLKIMEESGINKYLDSLGLDHKFITNLISGKELPFGELFNGSIDLDNTDNVIRWGVAAGLHIGYDPIKITDSFCIKNDQLALKKEAVGDIEEWLKARNLIYSLMIDSEMNVINAQLKKSISYAFLKGDIKESFFLMNDYEAYLVLKQSNEKSALLVDKIEKACYYKKVFYSEEEKDLVKPITNFRERLKVEKEIADYLGIPDEAVVLHAGRHSGSRKIHLPIVGLEDMVFGNEVPEKWLISVFIDPDLIINKSAVDSFFNERFKETSKR